MARAHCELWVHLIWTTKDRAPLLTKRKRFKIIDHIRFEANFKEYHVDVINGIEDHLHVLVAFKSTHTVSRIVNDIKGESSRWINENYILGKDTIFRWQGGYGAFTVSPSAVDRVRNYILNQEKHHQKMSLELSIWTTTTQLKRSPL